MKKVFTLLPIVAVMAACSSTPKDDYDKRAAAVESKREAAVERSLSKAGDWIKSK